MLGKLQRAKNKLSGEKLEQIQSLIGKVKNLSPYESKKFLLRHVDLFGLLQQKILNGGRPFVISDYKDELTEHKRGYGTGQKPQDYLSEITNAINKLKSVHDFSADELKLKWINSIETYLKYKFFITIEVFDEDKRFKQKGDFKRINKILGGQLAQIIDELNSYLSFSGRNKI